MGLENTIFMKACEKLCASYYKQKNYLFNYKRNIEGELIASWNGNDAIRVVIKRGKSTHDDFKKQDFFYFSYCYKGRYLAGNKSKNERILIKEGSLFAAQPYSGYSNDIDDEDSLIITMLIRGDLFYKEYLPTICSDPRLFHFLLGPHQNKYSTMDNIIIDFQNQYFMKRFFEDIVVEYASSKDDEQAVLKSMMQTLLIYISEYMKENIPLKSEDYSDDTFGKIIAYIVSNSNTTSLKDTANHFSYHPNYLSSLISKKLHKSFKTILIEAKMDNASTLLHNTDLTIEEIAYTVGYSDTANFYRAFKEFYGLSPKQYRNKN